MDQYGCTCLRKQTEDYIYSSLINSIILVNNRRKIILFKNKIQTIIILKVILMSYKVIYFSI